MGGKDHITGMVCDSSFFLSGDVIQELESMVHGILGWLGRLRYYGTNWAEQSGIDGTPQK